jgi:hypothetical protein
MTQIYGLIDPKKKAEILKRIREGKEPLFANVKPAPEQPLSGLGFVPDVEMQNRWLIDAVEARDIQGIKDALEAGANPNTMHNGQPLLMDAVSARDIVVLLIDNGADVNATGAGQSTALMQAASKGFYRAVKLLLLNDAEVNAKNDFGMTAFMYAAMNGAHTIMVELVDNGAAVNATNSKGMTALKMVREGVKEGHIHNSDQVISKLLEMGATE